MPLEIVSVSNVPVTRIPEDTVSTVTSVPLIVVPVKELTTIVAALTVSITAVSETLSCTVVAVSRISSVVVVVVSSVALIPVSSPTNNSAVLTKIELMLLTNLACATRVSTVRLEPVASTNASVTVDMLVVEK